MLLINCSVFKFDDIFGWKCELRREGWSWCFVVSTWVITLLNGMIILQLILLTVVLFYSAILSTAVIYIFVYFKLNCICWLSLFNFVSYRVYLWQSISLWVLNRLLHLLHLRCQFINLIFKSFVDIFHFL